MNTAKSAVIRLTPLSWYRMLGLFFGAGCSPVAPGTVGTLATVPLLLILTAQGPWFHVLATVAIAIAGIAASERLSREEGAHDHSGIVIDEVAGFLLTMAFIPISITTVVAGFILFRLFDILKPWPIGWLDRRVEGGLGIMLDDLVAGIFANAGLWLLIGFQLI